MDLQNDTQSSILFVRKLPSMVLTCTPRECLLKTLATRVYSLRQSGISSPDFQKWTEERFWCVNSQQVKPLGVKAGKQFLDASFQ